jgi:hypothetical protein
MWNVIPAFALALLAGARTGASDKPAPKRTDAQVRQDGEHCAWMLNGIGFAQRAWFPDGLEKAESTILTGDAITWPPPKTYSWRVAVLPSVEQTPLYERISKASDGFKVPGTVTAEGLKKLPKLQEAFQSMPELFALPSTKPAEGRTVFRRVTATAKPNLFIVIESSDSVPWAAPEEDLVVDDKKPLPKLGGNFAGGFFALCGDEKIRFLSAKLTDKQIREALLTGAGVPPIRIDSKAKLKQDIETLNLTAPPK